MRSLTVVVVIALLASTATADRTADFSAQLLGDTTGVTLVHGKTTWAMKVDDKTIETSIPSRRGDYLVFVTAKHESIVWIHSGDIDAKPAQADPAVRFFTHGKTRSVSFGELFSRDELAAIPLSTAGWRWVSKQPTIVDGTLSLPVFAGAAMVITSTTAIRAHASR